MPNVGQGAFAMIQNSKSNGGTNGIINVMAFGAKGDGATDDTAAIKAAIAELAASWSNGGTLYFPMGVYYISSTLDFSVYFTASVYGYVSIEMEPGAQIVATASMQQLINFTPAEGGQFLLANLRIGILNGNTLANNGLRVRNTSDSFIKVQYVVNCTGTGVLADSGSTPSNPVNGIFNNIWEIAGLKANHDGFASIGYLSSSPYGFQGNQVKIGHCINNVNGLNIDAAGGNSSWNVFDIGVSEHNTGAGMIDNNGQNIWRVGNANSNTNSGFVLASTVSYVPQVVGNFTDVTPAQLNGKQARFINTALLPGSLSAPAVPASTTVQKNTFNHQVQVCVSGGTVTVIAINGVTTGLTSGSFILNANDSITLTYSVAPSWTWLKL